MTLLVALSNYDGIYHPRPNLAPKKWGEIKRNLQKQAEVKVALAELFHQYAPPYHPKMARGRLIDVLKQRRRREMEAAVLRQTTISTETSLVDPQYSRRFGHVLAQCGAYDEALSPETSSDCHYPRIYPTRPQALPQFLHDHDHLPAEPSRDLLFDWQPFERRRSEEPLPTNTSLEIPSSECEYGLDDPELPYEQQLKRRSCEALSTDTSPEIPFQQVTTGMDDQSVEDFLRSCCGPSDASTDSSPESSPEIPSPPDTPPENPLQIILHYCGKYIWSSGHNSGESRVASPPGKSKHANPFGVIGRPRGPRARPMPAPF